MADTPAHWVRVKFDAYYGRWLLEDLTIGATGEPRWVKRREPWKNGLMVSAFREDEATARAKARRLSRELSPDIDLDKLHENGADSRSLKLAKTVVASIRHDEEQTLMFAEAQRRNAGMTPPRLDQLTLSGVARRKSPSSTTSFKPCHICAW